MGGRGPAGLQVNLLRIVELLQTHITAALRHAVFGRVRRTERQRVWTLDALVRFWTAVIVRAPTAFSQALADAREDHEPLFPRIKATPEAFFQRCRDLRPAFCAEVFRRFTARLVDAVPPRYAAEVAPICQRFADLVILDGSRLAAMAHRLKLLWNGRAVVLPGCLLGVYDVRPGLCRCLGFQADAASSELTRARPSCRIWLATPRCWAIACTARPPFFEALYGQRCGVWSGATAS